MTTREAFAFGGGGDLDLGLGLGLGLGPGGIPEGRGLDDSDAALAAAAAFFLTADGDLEDDGETMGPSDEDHGRQQLTLSPSPSKGSGPVAMAMDEVDELAALLPMLPMSPQSSLAAETWAMDVAHANDDPPSGPCFTALATLAPTTASSLDATSISTHVDEGAKPATAPSTSPPGTKDAAAITTITTSTNAPVKRSKGYRPRSRRPANYNPNKARDEQRRELRSLREQVVELERELGLLTLRATEARAITDGDQTLAAGNGCKRRLPGVWEEIATHQFQERLKAERENLRLKDFLEKQLHMTRRLVSTIKKCASNEYAGLYERPDDTIVPPNRVSDDPVLFRRLLSLIDRGYSEVDAVFERVGIAHLNESYQDARMREGENGLHMEVFGNKLLPFPLHMTSDVVWEHFIKTIKRMPTRHYRFTNTHTDQNSTQETVFETLVLTRFVNDIKTDFCVKQVFRRYREQDRIVIVWSGVLDPVEYAGQRVSGLLFRERGYILLKQPDLLQPTSSTVLKTCYVLTPELTPGSINHNDPLLRPLAEFFLRGSALTIAFSFQMIENVLMSQSLLHQHRRG